MTTGNKNRILLLAATAIFMAPVMTRAAELATLRNGFEIRHQRREVVGGMTRLFPAADGGRGYIEVPTDQIESIEKDESIKAPDPKDVTAKAANELPAGKRLVRPEDVDAAVKAASEAHSIDSDMIASIIHAESSFNPRALSPKGAQGLMQLMPGTAAKLGVNDSFDPRANVDGGTKYFRELLLRYHDDVAKALAAYNAGPQRVDQYKGIPPYRETRTYVARIINEYNRKKAAANKAKGSSHAAVRPATAKHNLTKVNSTGAGKDTAPQNGAGQ